MGALIAGRYDIVRELGRGGMGEVLLARQVNLGRLVVLKRVLPEHSLRYVRALLEEARLAARLHHPCIVSVLDVSADEDPAFVAMEYVAGVTLREMLHRAPDGLPMDVAIQIALDVLRGLDYAHGVRSGEHVGIVHRDIKPRNVMVTFAGDTKIIDFGISRWLSGDGAWEATSVSGTHGYMAPEQQQGQRVDARADQYAVGITLREMLTGVSPRATEETLDERRHEPRPTIEPGLALIVDKATAHDPTLRYDDCAQLASALEAYAKEHGAAPSTMHVERWMRDKLSDRIAVWEADAQRASEPSLPQMLDPTLRTAKPLSPGTMPPGPDLTAATVGERQTPPSTRVPSPSRRRTRWFVGIAVLSIVAGVTAAVLLRGGAPSRGPSLVAISGMTGSADEAWMVPAVEHLARRSLRDAPDRRFAVAAANDARPARKVELVVHHTGDGIQLEAHLAGASEPLARAAAPSIAEAVAQLTPALAAALSAGREPVGPDDDEPVAMAKLGARSIAELRTFRALSEDVRIAGWIDTSVFADKVEAMIREDPTWAHLYAELFWLRGSGSSARAKQVLVDARAHADPKRDPSGFRMIAALDAEAAGNFAEVIKQIEPVFHEDNADMLAGETLYAALINAHRGDDARAVFRRLQEQYPGLYFAADIAANLIEEGRDDQAERIVRDALAPNPDNLTAAREVVRFAAFKGDLASARREAQRALLVHGEQPIVLAELFEMMVLADDLTEAQRLVDRMLLGSPMSRARGRYRTAVLAVFEGRLGAAQLLTNQAIEEYGTSVGEQSEIAQCLTLLRSIGDHDAALAATTRLADWFITDEDLESAALYRYRAKLLEGNGTCPRIEDFVGGLDPVDVAEARRDMLRSAANAGCAKCNDVLAVGFSTGELGAESLVDLGRCAVREHDLQTARLAFERATRVWSSWWTNEASPYHAVLAHYELARVLEQLGEHALARSEYERFLRYWGRADRPVPEVAEAQRALKAIAP